MSKQKSGSEQFAYGLLLVFALVLLVTAIVIQEAYDNIFASPQQITLHNQTVLLWRGYGWNGVFYLNNCISSGIIEGPFYNVTKLNSSQLNESISILNKRYSSNMQQCQGAS